jgi:hypothetical protein
MPEHCPSHAQKWHCILHTALFSLHTAFAFFFLRSSVFDLQAAPLYVGQFKYTSQKQIERRDKA